MLKMYSYFESGHRVLLCDFNKAFVLPHSQFRMRNMGEDWEGNVTRFTWW